jgi:mannose-6-phosphate isomerase-like protein (cupin superfamily)
MKPFLLLLLLTPLFAADPGGFKLWKSQDLKSFTKSEMLSDFGNHNTRMTVRDKDGDVEIHQDWTDVMVIQSGEGSIVIGGTPVNPKDTGEGEKRAESVKGGEKHAITPGDIFNIPAGVPHQFLVPQGKKLVYFALKVAAK